MLLSPVVPALAADQGPDEGNLPLQSTSSPGIESLIPPDSTNCLGSWIWAAEAKDKQTCRFWKSFDLPPRSTVSWAKLSMTVDNSYRLLLDGREIGRGSDWRTMTQYDLTWVLKPGTHVLAIEAFNDRLQGGVLLGMRIELSNGREVEIKSDDSWRLVPPTEQNWLTRLRAPSRWFRATVVGEFHKPPWENMPYAVVQSTVLPAVPLRFWQGGWFPIATLTIIGLGLVFCVRLMAQLAVRLRAERLLLRERDRIARDIHDNLGAGLTQLVLLGEVAQQELPAEAGSRNQLAELCERARTLLGSMDELVWVVNSRRDSLRDFATYVCHYAQAYLRPTPIRCRLDVENELPAKPFDLPVRRNLLLAVKEALNNAARHSHADELFLRIHRDGDQVQVIVEDNGCGFALEQSNQDRNGLVNMSQRMKEVGGTCHVASRPGAGCRIKFTAPLREASAASWHWWNRLHRASASRRGGTPGSTASATLSEARTLEPRL